jgi:hypothetical protein
MFDFHTELKSKYITKLNFNILSELNSYFLIEVKSNFLTDLNSKLFIKLKSNIFSERTFSPRWVKSHLPHSAKNLPASWARFQILHQAKF